MASLRLGAEHGSGRGGFGRSLKCSFTEEDALNLEKELDWKQFPEEINAREETKVHEKKRIIPEELMWQRELVHRKKLDSLTKQACKDLKAPSSTALQTPSNSKIAGVKRHAPSEIFSYGQPQSLKIKPTEPEQALLFCKECQVKVCGETNLSQHYQGKKHRAKLEELNIWRIGGKIETGPVTCELCNIMCMNANAYQQHLLGKKHAAVRRDYDNAKAAKAEGGKEIPMTKWEDF